MVMNWCPLLRIRLLQGVGGVGPISIHMSSSLMEGIGENPL